MVLMYLKPVNTGLFVEVFNFNIFIYLMPMVECELGSDERKIITNTTWYCFIEYIKIVHKFYNEDQMIDRRGWYLII